MESELDLKRKFYFLMFVGAAIVGLTFVVDWFFVYGTQRAYWVANALHFSGGFYAPFFVRAFYLYTKKYHQIVAPPRTEIILFVSAALVLGVFWEWYEFAIDRYAVWGLGLPSIMTYADNIGDLLIDFMGALVAGLCVYYFRREQK